MSNLIRSNQKYLTLDNRLYIEKAISHGESFRDILPTSCVKDPATISKELKRHRLSDWYHKGGLPDVCPSKNTT